MTSNMGNMGNMGNMTRLVVTLNVKTENMVETCLYPGFVV